MRGLYVGLLPSVVKDSPYSAVYLLCYSRLKDVFVSRAAAVDWFSSSSGQHPIIQFSAAFIAGGFATTLFQPTEVIKTRLQLAQSRQPAAGVDAAALPPRHRVLHMVRTIHREDGLSGFMRGLLPRIIKRSLSNACGWMMFEQMVQFWSGTTGL